MYLLLLTVDLVIDRSKGHRRRSSSESCASSESCTSMDSLGVNSHPTIGTALALTAAGLTTLWFTRVKWAYWVDCALAAFLGAPERQRKNIYLNGVYKPVDTEADSEHLKVIGQLPRSLDGVFARVGPNPYFKPTGNYHVYVILLLASSNGKFTL